MVRELAHRHQLNMVSTSLNSILIGNNTNGDCGFCVGASWNPLTASADLKISHCLDYGLIISAGGVLMQLSTPGVTNMKAMYNTYVIDRVEITFRINAAAIMDTSQSNGVQHQVQPVLFGAVDTDDSTPVSRDELLQYGNLVTHTPTVDNPLFVSYVPAAEQSLLSATGTTQGVGFGRTFKPELDIAFPNIQHYGWKMFADGFKSTTSQAIASLSVQCKLFLVMKGTR